MFKKFKEGVKKAFQVDKKGETTPASCQSLLEDPDILMHIAKLAVQDPSQRGPTTDLENRLLEFYLDNLNDSAKE